MRFLEQNLRILDGAESFMMPSFGIRGSFVVIREPLRLCLSFTKFLWRPETFSLHYQSSEMKSKGIRSPSWG